MPNIKPNKANLGFMIIWFKMSLSQGGYACGYYGQVNIG